MLFSTTGPQKACELLPAHPTPVGVTQNGGKGHSVSQQAPSWGQMQTPVHGKPISECEGMHPESSPNVTVCSMHPGAAGQQSLAGKAFGVAVDAGQLGAYAQST